jgi:hypothetical protein
VNTNDDRQAAGRAASFVEPDLITGTGIIHRFRTATTARHISLENSL